ncbi:hypothetical protein OB919_15960 [Halobacteria archaeon AArc-curdl1]|uniref:Uncharacterized protein n=1 Tax=Natronosalvus hydrolyticus TaxID=2979988 RepID=A0AAP3E809_9EURY|nr:hypothetical protein [Halobacteria archaeon AArc-curdl1]
MPSPLNEDPTSHVAYETDEYDVLISYSVSDLNLDGYDGSVTSTREIKAEIIEERSDEIEVELEVTDNTNVGMFALGGTTENHPGGEFEQFSETVVFQKSDIPYFRGDFDDIAVELPLEETIMPNIKEWSESEPFRA